MAISVCLGAAIALGMSDLTSAYISETDERKLELKRLEDAIMVDLGKSAHGKAARLMPLLIAFINGSEPFLVALIITSLLALGHWYPQLISQPLETATLFAFLIIFLLGVFIGRISGRFWLWSGLRTLVIAFITTLLIYFISPA